MIAEPDSEDSQTPPWAQSGAEVEAPWEKQTANPKVSCASLARALSCGLRVALSRELPTPVL